MVDMGMDPFMIASSVILICAQRLARKICPHCKTPLEVSEDVLRRAGLTDADLANEANEMFLPNGCGRCTNGYKGRFALLETLRMSDEIKRMVIDGAVVQDVKNLALEQGMVTLRRAGLVNFMQGKTSLEEVERSTMAD